LLAFLGAELQPGFDLFARQAALERRLRTADLVVTGEGAIDGSTLMGKGVGQLVRRCRQLKIPCIALAGRVSSSTGRRAFFTQAHALTELTTVAQAKARPAYWLERLARKAARGAELLSGHGDGNAREARRREIRRPKSENRRKAENRDPKTA
jgi:glycerate kinase